MRLLLLTLLLTASSCGTIDRILWPAQHAAEHAASVAHKADEMASTIQDWLPYALNGLLTLIAGDAHLRRRKWRKKANGTTSS